MQLHTIPNSSHGIFQPYSKYYAAHHIVPEGDSNFYANEARKILNYYSISINSVANRVFLPTKSSAPEAGNSTIHTGRHNTQYSLYVYTKLNQAKSRGARNNEIVDILDSIRNELLNGTLKL